MTIDQTKECATELRNCLSGAVVQAIKTDLGNTLASQKNPPTFAVDLYNELMHPGASDSSIIPNPIGLL